jgi:preprotein translocase subunit SecE
MKRLVQAPDPPSFTPALEIRDYPPYLRPNSSIGNFMATTNPLQFIAQVRAEVAKITWPTRREVVLTTIMVFIMAALTATFFSLVDLGIRTGLAAIIG